MSTPNIKLLRRLSDADVEYVVVGGAAAVLLGSPVVTEDLDVCCPMTDDNIARIVAAMRGLDARFRFHPKHPKLPDEPESLRGFQNLNLTTREGDIDLLNRISGLGDYSNVAKHVVTMEVEGLPVRVLELDALIESKRAAGRDKDKLGVMHLEALKKRQGGGK